MIRVAVSLLVLGFGLGCAGFGEEVSRTGIAQTLDGLRTRAKEISDPAAASQVVALLDQLQAGASTGAVDLVEVVSFSVAVEGALADATMTADELAELSKLVDDALR